MAKTVITYCHNLPDNFINKIKNVCFYKIDCWDYFYEELLHQRNLIIHTVSFGFCNN